MGFIKNIKNEVFGRLTVIEECGKTKTGGNVIWKCRCECGNYTQSRGSDLRNGNTKSCGCYAIENTKIRNSTHGYTRVNAHAPEYGVWERMRGRCLNPKDNRFYRYGARGIKVCDRWLHSFENFISDMGRRPSKEHSLDRIENNGNYEPLNCRWGTEDQQVRNKSNNVWIEFEGRKQILADWLVELKTHDTSYYRRNKNKYPAGEDWIKYIKSKATC